MKEKYVCNEPKIAEFMLKFLRVGYPVGRIKVNRRFKRGININGIKLLIPKDHYHFQNVSNLRDGI